MSYFTRIVRLVHRPSLERELDDEIQFHMEERQRRNIALGMPAEAAEADAHRRFGSIERAKAGMRAARLARPAAVVLPLTRGRTCPSVGLQLDPSFKPDVQRSSLVLLGSR
jgi:hypothetical protein